MRDLLDELNQSELLILAQEHNPNVHRGLTRETLYAIISGEEVEVPDRHVDRVRLKIMEFIDAHFEQVEPIVQACPAKTRDPRACFQCTDIQVMECALTNPIIFQKNE